MKRLIRRLDEIKREEKKKEPRVRFVYRVDLRIRWLVSVIVACLKDIS